MKKEVNETIVEVEQLKDVIWFLRGVLLVKQDDYEFPLNNSHINAISQCINYIYSNEARKNKDD